MLNFWGLIIIVGKTRDAHNPVSTFFWGKIRKNTKNPEKYYWEKDAKEHSQSIHLTCRVLNYFETFKLVFFGVRMVVFTVKLLAFGWGANKMLL